MNTEAIIDTVKVLFYVAFTVGVILFSVTPISLGLAEIEKPLRPVNNKSNVELIHSKMYNLISTKNPKKIR
jgi:hypothetical protein